MRTGEIIDRAAIAPDHGAGDPQSDLAAALRPVFERVLRCRPVREDDDFFDLGGDSLMAIELMLSIKQETGHDLPMTAIYDASSPRSLAGLLLAEARPASTTLVLLRPGTMAAPLFIAHGLGGSAMELRSLANRIDTQDAIYGIEARGLDGLASPFERVEDMARFHVDEVRRVQPAGPYLLAGFSFGGLVALEMARILSDTGERIALLALFDSFPHTKFWPFRSRVTAWRQVVKFSGTTAVVGRVARYHRSVLRQKSPRAAAAYVISRAWRAVRIAFNIFRLGAWIERFADQSTAASAPLAAAVPIPPAVHHVQRSGEIAYRQYRPRYFDGDITFLKASGEWRVPFDAETLWGRLVRRITVISVPGDHQNVVRGGAA